MTPHPAEPRIWVRLGRPVSQTAPELFGRAVTHPGGQWIEIRGPVGYPGEENLHGQQQEEWSFWQSGDIDLAPIFDGDDVERVYVEPGHPLAHKLKDASRGESPFEVTVAEGPPARVET